MKKVLFVCIHNSGRSQMAKAFFNAEARGRAFADSAGTNPADHVNETVVKVMKEVGIDISNSLPKTLTLEMAGSADRMITMGCGADAGEVCPAGIIKTEDWKLDDPHDASIEEVRRIRDAIRERVIDLLKELGIG